MRSSYLRYASFASSALSQVGDNLLVLRRQGLAKDSRIRLPENTLEPDEEEVRDI